jgi:hypothetical protein
MARAHKKECCRDLLNDLLLLLLLHAWLHACMHATMHTNCHHGPAMVTPRQPTSILSTLRQRMNTQPASQHVNSPRLVLLHLFELHLARARTHTHTHTHTHWGIDSSSVTQLWVEVVTCVSFGGGLLSRVARQQQCGSAALHDALGRRWAQRGMQLLVKCAQSDKCQATRSRNTHTHARARTQTQTHQARQCIPHAQQQGSCTAK